MASSAHNQQHHLPNMNGATPAPPPTPSTLPSNNHLSTSTATSVDALSKLLHRLPPTLSLPSRRRSRDSPPPSAATHPLISLSYTNPNNELSSAVVGFFQLTDHNIPSQLAHSAESESLSLFKLDKEKKESYFPQNWPVGYNNNDDDDEEDGNGESFCLDSSSSSTTDSLSLSSLNEFIKAMEKVGLNVIEMLASAVGFENPFKEDPTRSCSLMWISQSSHGDKSVSMSGGAYPYIVGLHYQIRQQKYSLLSDSGSVVVSPQVDSVLVTIGDIAQVWSNGKLKKVRGRPVACLEDGGNTSNSPCISMTLLVTLPLDSRVAPVLVPNVEDIGGCDENNGITGLEEDESYEIHGSTTVKKEKRVFDSFSFVDYAWRVYHERLPLKDSLDRYRI